MATGGSTNAVLHLIATARDFGVRLSIDDFDRISKKTPVLADLKPWGNFTAPEMYEAGGMAVVGQRLVEAGLLHAAEKTVTGHTIGDEVKKGAEAPGQKVIKRLADRATHLEQRLAALGADDVLRPLVRVLVRRAERTSSGARVETTLRKLAEDAGVSLVEAHRALAQLMDQRLLRLVEDVLWIGDLEALSAVLAPGE